MELKITREAALLLLETVEPIGAAIALDRAVANRDGIVVAAGCKVTGTKRGAVTSYKLTGYAPDGSDVYTAIDTIPKTFGDQMRRVREVLLNDRSKLMK